MTMSAWLPTEVGEADQDPVSRVYRYASSCGVIDTLEAAADALGMPVAQVRKAVDQLVAHRLLRAADLGGRQFMPVDPDVAAASLVSSVEREIYQRRELIAQINERIDTFRQDYAIADRQSGNADQLTDYLAGPMEVLGLLKWAGDTCQEELVVLYTGDADSIDIDELTQVCLPLQERGIRTRILCQHRDRVDFAQRIKMKKLTAAGASVSTVSHIPRSAVVFDRVQAVLFGMSDGATSAVRIRHGATVQFLLDLFDHLWDGANPMQDGDTGYAGADQDIQQRIALLMAKGYTDEVVARKLGMSVRTCRRHIAALLRDLDSTSRFQAGVQAARRLFGAAPCVGSEQA